MCESQYLKNVKAVSDIMLFDDRVGYSAVVLEGNYPQKHMKNQKDVNFACIKDSRKEQSSHQLIVF